MNKHSCTEAEAASGHAVKAIISAFDDKSLHIPEGKRFPVFCGCHGHCAECREAVLMCKWGRFHHVAAY
jgi:hypothetical protein